MQACNQGNTVTSKDQFKVGDNSLIIHKSAYHLFSLLISKQGFSSLQTTKIFGKIPSGNYRFVIPVIRVTATQLRIPITSSFTLLRNISIVLTNNRLVLLLPMGPIMIEIINAPATKSLFDSHMSCSTVKNN